MQARDLSLLLDAAQSAGDIAQKFFQRDPEVWDKKDNQGPVTEADLAIDRMLRNELLKARPDYGWLSEETEDTGDRLHHDHVFIVDPIDGTRAFVNGEKSFSHSLAIAKNGKIIAAVIHVPMLQKTYAATVGHGARCNAVPIKPSNALSLTDAKILTTKPVMHGDNWRGDVPKFERHFRPSIAYRLCIVSDGRFDGMLTLRDTWEWDVAAGDLIVSEAGGKVSDRFGQPPVYNNPVPTLSGLIAAPAPVHDDMMRNLKPH